MNRIALPGSLAGRIAAPPSKSSMQRAIACALLADGESLIRNPSFCDDALAAMELARALGAGVLREPGLVRIGGAARRFSEARGRHPDGDESGIAPRLACGESGLCMRMFTPVAALLPGARTLEAGGSLARRPMEMVSAPLQALGAAAETSGGFPPLRIRGPLRGGSIRVDARASSQLLTGLLIALPFAAESSILNVDNPVSTGYLDLTLDTMRAFGVRAARDSGFTRFDIPGGQRYRACDFTVEGDWSGAAFLLVAGAIAGIRQGAIAGSLPDAAAEGITVTGLQRASSQPDRAILDALERAGAGLEFDDARAEVRVAPAPGLRGFEFDARDCPDLFPPLVALASACKGESRIEGASRLKAKESDRASVLIGEFASLGITVRRDGDALAVSGGRLRQGRVDSHGDHRIAMAAAVAALRLDGGAGNAAGAGVEIEGAECVAKSWPGFFDDLDSLRIR